MREALRILEKDAVVRILPNRGAHVTQLSIKEVDDIFEIRRVLSGAMIARLTAEEAAQLAAAIDADIRALDALAQDPKRRCLLRDLVPSQPHRARGLRQ